MDKAELSYVAFMNTLIRHSGLLLCLVLVTFVSCRNAAGPASKINRANFDQIHTGMSQSEVQAILGPPSSVSTEDKIIYKRTIWRYVQADKYINLTFKNDGLDSKDTNL